MAEKLNDYVVFARNLTEMVRQNELAPPELLILTWIRLLGDPYGKAVLHLGVVAEDLNKTKNYVNKVLLKLKKLGLISYKARAGHRGSFTCHFDFWIFPDGQTRPFQAFLHHHQDNLFAEKPPKTTLKHPTSSQSFDAPSPSKEESIRKINLMFYGNERGREVRGNDTDTDIQKDKNTHN